MRVKIIRLLQWYEGIHRWDRLHEALGRSYADMLKIDANRGTPVEGDIWKLVLRVKHPEGGRDDIVLLERDGRYIVVTQYAYEELRFEGRNKL